MSNPPKTLTNKELEEIESLAGLGLRYTDIALIKGMSDDTLKKYAGEQLKRGKAKARAQIMKTAYKLALDGKSPAMTMFWLKARAGWQEGQPDPDSVENIAFNLVEKMTQSNTPTVLLTAYLVEVMEQLKQGQLNPQIASALSNLSMTLMKANEQGNIQERITNLETVMQHHKPEILELDLNLEEYEEE